MKLPRVISGGQSGVDQGALRAAQAVGLATGGWASKGWLAEVPHLDTEGVPFLDASGHQRWVTRPCPWLADWGLEECQAEGFASRTRANVLVADSLIWIGNTSSRGYRTTLDAARYRNLEYLIASHGQRPSEVAAWITSQQPETLLIAGNRESVWPGIGERAERFLVAVFRRLVGSQKNSQDY